MEFEKLEEGGYGPSRFLPLSLSPSLFPLLHPPSFLKSFSIYLKLTSHHLHRSQTAYMFRLYLEWARLVSPKRGLMDFEFTTEPVIVPVGAGPNHRSPRSHAHQLALEKLRITRPPAVQEEGEGEE